MAEHASTEPSGTSTEGCELETGILFMDLVDSSIFASVLGLREYADHLESFRGICLGQCRHFFGGYLEGNHQEGPDYSARILGDELLVFVHTGRPHNDVYLLASLAATLKAAWLAAPLNQQRAARRQTASQLSGGIHYGRVWATPNGNGYDFSGYAINMAKRIEGHSRTGSRYRILLSDHAFKHLHFRQRNLIFGPCMTFESKGLLGLTTAYEIHSTFINLAPRLDPEILETVRALLADAINVTTRDLWTHDFHQVWNETECGGVTEPAMNACRSVLLHEPSDPISLYHLAQALCERGDPSTARIVLRELTAAWPRFGDGHLELSKVFRLLDDQDGSLESLRVARLLGIDDSLP